MSIQIIWKEVKIYSKKLRNVEICNKRFKYLIRRRTWYDLKVLNNSRRARSIKVNKNDDASEVYKFNTVHEDLDDYPVNLNTIIDNVINPKIDLGCLVENSGNIIDASINVKNQDCLKEELAKKMTAVDNFYDVMKINNVCAKSFFTKESDRKKLTTIKRSKRRYSSTSDTDSDNDVIPRKRSRGLKEKFKRELESNEILTMKVTFLEKENAELKQEIIKLKEECKEVRKRNYCLQNELIMLSKDIGVDKSKEGKTNDEQVVRIGNISLDRRDIDLINKRSKHSIFVKELVDRLWTREVLVNRSLTGKLCPRKKGVPNPPLTPEKVDYIKELFRRRLKSLGYTEYTIPDQFKFFNRYLSEKINDTQKREVTRKLKYTLTKSTN